MIDGVKQELEKAKRDTASALAFYRFCRDNPRYSVQANEGFLRAYCDENGLTYTKEHFEEAAKMVSHLLAQKESVKPPTPAPEPVKSPEEQHAEEAISAGVSALTGGIGNLDTTGSSSTGEQFMNFLSGA